MDPDRLKKLIERSVTLLQQMDGKSSHRCMPAPLISPWGSQRFKLLIATSLQEIIVDDGLPVDDQFSLQIDTELILLWPCSEYPSLQ